MTYCRRCSFMKSGMDFLCVSGIIIKYCSNVFFFDRTFCERITRKRFRQVCIGYNIELIARITLSRSHSTNNFIWVFKIRLSYQKSISDYRAINDGKTSPNFQTNHSADLPVWIHRLGIYNLTKTLFWWINIDYFPIYMQTSTLPDQSW